MGDGARRKGNPRAIPHNHCEPLSADYLRRFSIYATIARPLGRANEENSDNFTHNRSNDNKPHARWNFSFRHTFQRPRTQIEFCCVRERADRVLPCSTPQGHFTLCNSTRHGSSVQSNFSQCERNRETTQNFDTQHLLARLRKASAVILTGRAAFAIANLHRRTRGNPGKYTEPHTFHGN